MSNPTTEQIKKYGYQFGEFYGGMIRALQEQGFSLEMAHALGISLIEKIVAVTVQEVLKKQGTGNIDQLLTQALKNSTPIGNA